MAEKTEQQKALEAKAAEYSALIGKTFQPNEINKFQPEQLFTVTKYLGVHRHNDGVLYHTLEVEISNPTAGKWTPAASKFLAEYTEVQVKPETATDEIK